MFGKNSAKSLQIAQHQRETVCVPTQGLVHAEFTYCLVNAIKRTELDSVSVSLVMHEGTVLSNQRQHIAVEALDKFSPDYLMWFDSDMTFPADVILRLIDSDKSVVCAAYSKRTPPLIPTAFLDIDPVVPVKIQGNLQPVRYAGMGCMLVKASVMRSLEMPWFPLIWHNASKSWHGEDMGFCDLLHKNNIEIWCDTQLSLELGHLGTVKNQLNQED
jgi:hypothetical protein